MPDFHFVSLWARDPRRWAKMNNDIAKEMVAEGWNPRAKKFNEVRQRRARSRWSKTPH